MSHLRSGVSPGLPGVGCAALESLAVLPLPPLALSLATVAAGLLPLPPGGTVALVSMAVIGAAVAATELAAAVPIWGGVAVAVVGVTTAFCSSNFCVASEQRERVRVQSQPPL